MTAIHRFVRAVLGGVLVIAASAPPPAAAQVGVDTPIASMSLSPASASLTVGQTQGFGATAVLGDPLSTTRLLGGNGGAFWNLIWGPGIDVSACGTTAVGFRSQSFTIDAGGAFHAVWSPSTPNTLKADGVMSLPTSAPGATVTGALQCVNGATTGSFTGFWNVTQYDGTFTFGTQTGETAVVGLSWTSSNPSVASVDRTGRVTAMAPGDTVITATFGSRCWLPSAGVNLSCRGTVTATAAVHVDPNGGGGGGGDDDCTKLTFILLPGSEPANAVSATLIDPSTGAELGTVTIPINQTVAPPPGQYHLRLAAPAGLSVTPVQHGLNLACGDDKIVRVRFRRER